MIERLAGPIAQVRALPFQPRLRRRQESAEDARFVDRGETAEMAVARAVQRLVAAVDLGGDAPDRRAAGVERDPELGVAVPVEGMLLRVELVRGVVDEGRNEVRVGRHDAAGRGQKGAAEGAAPGPA